MKFIEKINTTMSSNDKILENLNQEKQINISNKRQKNLII